MSTEAATKRAYDTTEINWVAAAVAGLVGTVAFGGLQMLTGSTGVVAGAIPALYGLGPSLTVGWAVHLFHGAVLGLAFAALLAVPGVGRYADDLAGLLGLGVAYGVVTTIALAWLLMPVWLSAVGFANAPPFPNVGTSSLIGHLVYGVVLAGAYAGLREQL